MSEQYKIRSINDMVVTVDGGQGLSMQDMVYLGDKRLIGEVVGVDSEKVTVQVYESTTGLAPWQPVYSTGGPMSIQLGPGLLRGIFDGIARPLEAPKSNTSTFLLTVPSPFLILSRPALPKNA